MRSRRQQARVNEACHVADYMQLLLTEIRELLVNPETLSRGLHQLEQLRVCLAYELVYQAGGTAADLKKHIEEIPPEPKAYPPLKPRGSQQLSIPCPSLRATLQAHYHQGEANDPAVV